MSESAGKGVPPWSASNEEVHSFIQRYGTTYSPNDAYPVNQPFAEPVKAGKNTAIYNAHSYPTKVPPLGIVPYLEHYTSPNDLVLDPFCGSGMTGIACIMTGRRAILNDLCPAATHIAYNYCTPVDIARLQTEWQQVKTVIADEFAYLYGTVCDRCGGAATIDYTVWSDVFGCLTCGNDLLLWDLAVVRKQTPEGYDPPLSLSARTLGWAPPLAGPLDGLVVEPVLGEFNCPICRSRWRKTQLTRRRSEPVMTSYRCARCKPAHNAHATSGAEQALIKQIGAEPISYWYPTLPFESSREMWRGAHRDAGITRVCDFWTHRNLRALARLWHEASKVEDERLRRGLLFLITSAFPRSSRTTRYLFGKGGNSALTGTLYVGSFTTENNLLTLLDRKARDVFSALTDSGAIASSPVITTLHAGQDLGIPDASVDYVFTDPPFGSNIFYSDCLLLWEAWLGYVTDDRYEAVWNKSRKPSSGGKTLADYQRLMTEAFQEIYRVLKPGRWASVVFHNSDDKVWNAIRDAVTESGFSLENAVYLDKEQRSFKGIKGQKGEERVSNFDIVLNLRKSAETKQLEMVPQRIEAIPLEVQERILNRIEDHLRVLASGAGGYSTTAVAQRTTQFIHSRVIQELMSSGQVLDGVSYAAVEATLQEFFRQVDGYWYLPGEGVWRETPELIPDIRDETSAIEWLRHQLVAGPKLEGDLIDAFHVASVKARLSKGLRQILEENFTFEPRRGRWRLPTPAETQRKMDVTRVALQARVQRYLAEPAPMPPSTLAAWLRDCYKRELYDEAHLLFSHIPRGTPDVVTYADLRKLNRVAGLKVSERREEAQAPSGG